MSWLPYLHSLVTKLPQDSVVAYTEPPGNHPRRPALLVETYDFWKFLPVEAAAVGLDAVFLEVVGCRSSMDVEGPGKFFHRHFGFPRGDEGRDLVMVESLVGSLSLVAWLAELR